MHRLPLPLAGLALALGIPGAGHPDPGDAEAIYARSCAVCHGSPRYGGYAPPLIPSALRRRTDDELARAILEGRSSTQMPAFAADLDETQARSLVTWLRTPVAEVRWEASDIETSREELGRGGGSIPGGARRENLILVVERGSGGVSILDGDSLQELDRFAAGRVHGGLKFDRALRDAYAATRGGSLVAYDLERGRLRARVKVGVNTRNISVSSDGRFVAAANQLPASLVLLDRALHPLRVLPLEGQPSGVYPVPGQARFLLALRDAPRLLVVDLPSLETHEIEVPQPFEDFVFVPGGRRLLASSRQGHSVLLWDLDARRTLGTLETEGLPHLFSACFFERGGVPYAALNHVGRPHLSVIDMERFRVERELELAGSGFFVRTHAGTPYLWADTNTDAIDLIDKVTLEPVRRLVPEAGKTAMHVEFTAEGDRALVSVWDPEGAIVAYDARTLEEVGRLPYAMPVGKYNPFNKTRLFR